MLESVFNDMKKDLKVILRLLQQQVKSKKVQQKDKDMIKELLDKWK